MADNVAGIPFTLDGYKQFFKNSFPSIYEERGGEAYSNWGSDFERDKSLFDKETYGFFGEDFDAATPGTQPYDTGNAAMQGLWEAYLRGYDIYGYLNSGAVNFREAFAGGLVPLNLIQDIFDTSADKIKILLDIISDMREMLNRIEETLILESHGILFKGQIASAYTAKAAEISKGLKVMQTPGILDDINTAISESQKENLKVTTAIEQVKNARRYVDDERSQWDSALTSAGEGRSQLLDQITKIFDDLGSILIQVFR